MAAVVGGMLFIASCTSVPYEGLRTASGLPQRLDTGAGQVLRYCKIVREKGNLAVAAGLCERAHQLDPGNPEPPLQLAGILTQMGELNLAVAAYRTVLDLSPDHVEALYGLGRTYVALKQYDLALGEFRTALRGQPDDTRLYNAVGVADGLLGAHASAQAVFRAGLEKAPKSVTLRNNLGLSLVLSGNYAEGLPILEAVAADPKADKASYENLLLAQGLYAQARTDAMLATATGLKSGDPASAGESDAADRLPDDAALDAVFNEANQAAAPDAAPDATATPAPPVTADWPRRTASAIAAAQEAAASPPEQADPEPEDPAATSKPTALTDAFGPLPEEAPAAPAPRALPAPAPSIRMGPAMQTARAGATDYPMTPFASAPESVPEIAPESAGPDLGPKDYVVQFASYSSDARARLGWDLLSAAAPDLLAGRTPNIQRADLGAGPGVFYRLRSQPEPEAAARRLCDALSQRTMDCLVMRIVPADEADAAPPQDTGAPADTSTGMPANPPFDMAIQPAAGATPEAEPEAGSDLPPLP